MYLDAFLVRIREWSQMGGFEALQRSIPQSSLMPTSVLRFLRMTEMFELTSEPLSAEKLVECVRRDEAGAVVLFYGVVRNENLGRRVLYLEYDAYPEMAEAEMRRVADDIRVRWPAVTEIAAQHRTGRLEIGEASLLVAVSAPHRREAFEAAHAYVDLLKERVPVWKKEVFEGGEEWIEGDSSRRD